jgi:N-acyl-D-amino-acid deacylase
MSPDRTDIQAATVRGSRSSEYDLIVRDGLVVDGADHEPFVADVAVRGDRIAAVGAVKGSAAREIDAKGKLVLPGFVDIHTHYDGQAIWSERLNPSSSHGVTTAVMGNCGVGFAPCRSEDHDLLIRVMEGVEDIPGVVMAEGLPWTWETFPEYLDALEGRRHDIDVAAYLPHSPLRIYVMGERGANREAATSDDLARMRALSREAISAGALGIASSRLFFHRTNTGEQIPSFDAADAELRQVAAGMSDAGKGIIQLVLDVPHRSWESEMVHLIELVKSSGRPATFTMATANQGPRIWDAAMAMLEQANAQGASITAQILPRPIGLIAGFQLSVHPFCLCPSYRALAALPLEERIAQLRKPEVREKLTTEKPLAGHPLVGAARVWNWMFPLGDSPNYEPPLNTSIGAQAAMRGVKPEAVAYDYLLQKNGAALLYLTLGNYYEGKFDSIRELLSHPHSVTGLGDGGAHYGMICDASYPTFMLMYWVRDRKGPRLSLAKAVSQLTRAPAKAVGLLDRGLIAAGYKADLNVIDLDRLQLHSPQIRFDLPAGGRRLDQTATGYEATIVSGQVVRRNDQPTGILPGRLVRGARPLPLRPS